MEHYMQLSKELNIQFTYDYDLLLLKFNWKKKKPTTAKMRIYWRSIVQVHTFSADLCRSATIQKFCTTILFDDLMHHT